jgi:hypothetical protein
MALNKGLFAPHISLTNGTIIWYNRYSQVGAFTQSERPHMGTSLEDVMLALPDIPPEQLTRYIHGLFEKVVRLDIPSVIATWQFVDLCKLSTEEGSMEQKLMNKLQEACITRMSMLYISRAASDIGMVSDDLRTWFLGIIGTEHRCRF